MLALCGLQLTRCRYLGLPSYRTTRYAGKKAIYPLRSLPLLPPRSTRFATTLTLPTEDSEVPPKTAADDSEIPPGYSVGHLYFDSVFPLTLGSLDPRAYLSSIYASSSLENLKSALPDVQSIGFQFRVLGVESRSKDGGAFLTFAYKPDSSAPLQSKAELRRIPSSSSLSTEEASTLTIINNRIRPHLKPIPQFILSPYRLIPASYLSPPRAHIVLGTPWLEDLSRYPSRTIKMSFIEGNAPTEQQLWEMLRPYGRVQKMDIDGKANQATASYYRMRGATSARNCLYGANIGGRKVLIDYLPPLHSHKIWDWLSSHPRIVFPILAFFLGSITYAVFDPIRGWFVKSNVENTFDLDAYPLYAWLRKKTIGLFSSSVGSKGSSLQDDWWERKAAADEIQSWLREAPTTFITISGPRGSGKHQLLERAVNDSTIKHLTINCEEIARTTKNEEATLVPAVAKQVGYFPVFNWINSLNSLIDLASVGLIGSKAGFSTPTDAQLKQVLAVTTAALVSIKEDTRKKKEKEAKRAGAKATQGSKGGGAGEATTAAAVVSGKSEKINNVSTPTPLPTTKLAGGETGKEAASTTELRYENRDELGPDATLLATVTSEAEERSTDVPVVVIDGYHHKGVKSDLLWTVLGDWAAELTSSKIAHVIFVSDNPVGMSKTLSRSLPNVPFETIVLADADEDRARGYVYSKLKEMGKVEGSASIVKKPNLVETNNNNQSSIASIFSRAESEGKSTAGSSSNMNDGLDAETAKWVDYLGGRLTDLENLVQKVSLGQSVENAVKDIIARTVVEIRKNTFGDDMEDAKSLPWSRGQAWIVVEQLAAKGEIPYYALLHDSFKSDESALKALEQAEIISVRHLDSRPSSIRAGRPVIQQALQSLVSDEVFANTQRFLSNTSSIDSCEKIIKEVEAEIRELGEGVSTSANVLKSSSQTAAKDRFEYLLEKLAVNQDKIRSLEKKNEALKRKLSQQEVGPS